MALARGPRVVHAREIQRSNRVLRTDREKELQQRKYYIDEHKLALTCGHVGLMICFCQLALDSVGERDCVGQLVRVSHNDGAKRRGRRADEENRKGRGAAVLSRARKKSLSPLHCQSGHRVN